MGARSGGGGGAGFGRAADSLYNAIAGGNKSAISAATSKMAKMISKMPTDQVKASAQSASMSAYLTGNKKNMPKSEWNPTVAKYNNTLAKLYNKEANSRK